jgi:hypothetical protein
MGALPLVKGEAQGQCYLEPNRGLIVSHRRGGFLHLLLKTTLGEDLTPRRHKIPSVLKE